VASNLPVPSSANNSGRTSPGREYHQSHRLSFDSDGPDLVLAWGTRAPPEILCAIFAHLQGKAEFYDSVQHNPPLLRVCRLWNTTLVNDPNLWITPILIRPTCSPNSTMGRPSLRPGFRTWLGLSRAHKVRLTLRLEPRNPHERVTADELAVHIGPSLRYLCVDGSPKDFSPVLLEQLMKMVTTGAPNLKSLKLFMLHAAEITDMRPRIVNIQLPVTVDGLPTTFPSLEELQLEEIMDVFPRIPCPQLKRFTCNKAILTDRIGRTSFLRLLHSAPRLELMNFNDCRLRSVLGGATRQEFPPVLRQFFVAAGSQSLSTLMIDLVTLVATVNSEGVSLMDHLPNIEVVKLNTWRKLKRRVRLAELQQFFKPSRNLISLILFASGGNEETTMMIENIIYPGGSFQYPNLKEVQVIGVTLTKAQIRRIIEKHDTLNLLRGPAERSSKKLHVHCHHHCVQIPERLPARKDHD
jgi:hypothetical protein